MVLYSCLVKFTRVLGVKDEAPPKILLSHFILTLAFQKISTKRETFFILVLRKRREELRYWEFSGLHNRGSPLGPRRFVPRGSTPDPSTARGGPGFKVAARGLRSRRGRPRTCREMRAIGPNVKTRAGTRPFSCFKDQL